MFGAFFWSCENGTRKLGVGRFVFSERSQLLQTEASFPKIYLHALLGLPGMFHSVCLTELASPGVSEEIFGAINTISTCIDRI